MFCTKCGTELREQDKFCFECGVATGRGTPPRTSTLDRLTRPVTGTKMAGVCAGFARYFGIDVTLVRIVWLVLVVWPVPLFGLIAYIVAWAVMPKDPVPAPATSTELHPASPV